MAVSLDLLEILRCPYCVSGPTRKEGDDPGQLELVNDTWLVCREAGCGRKYPIKEDIPVMLIDEGDKWINTPVEELPEPGPLVEPTQFSLPNSGGMSMQAPQLTERKRLALLLLGLLGAIVLIGGAMYLFLGPRNRR